MFLGKIITIILIICISFGFITCSKEEKQNDIQEIINNKNISDEEALYRISRIIFSNSLKSFKSEKNQLGKQEVTIEYGGSRAYTFYTESNYIEKIQFETVRYILLFFQSGQKRNLNNLRISVVKPYFVKESEVKKELTEEFEIFRASISFSDIVKVPDWENPKLINSSKNSNNSKIIELFNQVRLQWKIELNELNRIELR